MEAIWAEAIERVAAIVGKNIREPPQVSRPVFIEFDNRSGVQGRGWEITDGNINLNALSTIPSNEMLDESTSVVIISCVGRNMRYDSCNNSAFIKRL